MVNDLWNMFAAAKTQAPTEDINQDQFVTVGKFAEQLAGKAHGVLAFICKRRGFSNVDLLKGGQQIQDCGAIGFHDLEASIFTNFGTIDRSQRIPDFACRFGHIGKGHGIQPFLDLLGTGFYG